MPKRTSSKALTVPITDYQHPAISALEENDLRYALRHDDPQTAILGLGGDHGNFTLSRKLVMLDRREFSAYRRQDGRTVPSVMPTVE